MNPDPHITHQNGDETPAPQWLAVLRKLPSEHAKPSAATDEAILAHARKSLFAIRRRKALRLTWPTLAAAACLVIAFSFLARPGPTVPQDQAADTSEDPYAVILREVTSLFPHQIRAIMTNGGELRIALSEEPVADGAQAVVIEACGNGDCTVVITYVGQTVEIEHQQVTVRAGEDGTIIIQSRKGTAPDLKIKSRSI